MAQSRSTTDGLHRAHMQFAEGKCGEAAAVGKPPLPAHCMHALMTPRLHCFACIALIQGAEGEGGEAAAVEKPPPLAPKEDPYAFSLKQTVFLDLAVLSKDVSLCVCVLVCAWCWFVCVCGWAEADRLS